VSLPVQPEARERELRHLAAIDPSTLDTLAETANREHHLALAAASTFLTHAINVGQALIAARNQIPQGGWESWLRKRWDGGSLKTARAYIRIARHHGQLPEGEATSIKAALRLLEGAPGPQDSTDPAKREAVIRLRRSGASIREVAERLEIPKTTVGNWSNPAAVRRRREEDKRVRAAVRAERQARELKRAVRKAGAALSEAYAMAERMQGVLAQAIAEAESVEARRALEEATRLHHRTRDEIVRALVVSPP
jgi:transposase